MTSSFQIAAVERSSVLPVVHIAQTSKTIQEAVQTTWGTSTLVVDMLPMLLLVAELSMLVMVVVVVVVVGLKRVCMWMIEKPLALKALVMMQVVQFVHVVHVVLVGQGVQMLLERLTLPVPVLVLMRVQGQMRVLVLAVVVVLVLVLVVEVAGVVVAGVLVVVAAVCALVVDMLWVDSPLLQSLLLVLLALSMLPMRPVLLLLLALLVLPMQLVLLDLHVRIALVPMLTCIQVLMLARALAVLAVLVVLVVQVVLVAQVVLLVLAVLVVLGVLGVLKRPALLLLGPLAWFSMVLPVLPEEVVVPLSVWAALLIAANCVIVLFGIVPHAMLLPMLLELSLAQGLRLMFPLLEPMLGLVLVLTWETDLTMLLVYLLTPNANLLAFLQRGKAVVEVISLELVVSVMPMALESLPPVMAVCHFDFVDALAFVQSTGLETLTGLSLSAMLVFVLEFAPTVVLKLVPAF